MNKTEIVPITQALAEKFYGDLPSYSFRGYAVRSGSDILGLGGVYVYQGKRYLFGELAPGARESHRKTLVKVTKKVIKDNDRRTLFAIAQEGVEGAGKLLEHVGFRLINETHNLYMRG